MHSSSDLVCGSGPTAAGQRRDPNVVPPVCRRMPRLHIRETCSVLSSPRLTIPMNVAALDAVLGGGFHCSQIYEVFGSSGVGKSQLALSLAAEVMQLDDQQTRGVLYLDSKCDFQMGRLAQLVHLRELVLKKPPVRACNLKAFRYKKLFSLEELKSVLERIALEKKAKVGLLIVDTLAALVLPLMTKSHNLGEIFGTLGRIIALLRKIAVKHTICVLVLNHATWKSGHKSQHPSLGKMFINGANVRLCMAEPNCRSRKDYKTITLEKGAFLKLNTKCQVRIGDGGLISDI